MLNLRIYLCYFACIWITLNIVSCQRNNSDTTEILTKVIQIVELNPDSALSLLDSITFPYDLNKEEYNKYLLLQIQTKDKAYRDIASDTVVFQVRDYYMQKNDVENTALASFYCGRVLQEQSENEQAIKEYQTAEKYAEDIKNNTLRGLIQNAIGSILLKEFMEPEAIEHFTKAALYFNKANNTRNEVITYNQMGNAYLMKTVNDSAFYYYEKGFKLAEISKDSLQMANITQCIGIAHRQTGNVNLAVRYFRDATKYTANDDYRSKLYLNLSKTFYERGMQDSARLYVNKSLSIAQSGDINLLANIYKTLSLIAEKQSNLDLSLSYYKKHAEYLEQIVDKNKNTEILELQKKYKSELLQNENNQLKIEEQRIFLIFAIAIIIFGIISAILYKNSQENKKKALEKEKKILDAEKKIYQLIEMSNNYNERESSFKNILLHHFNILKKAALLKQHIDREDEQALLSKKVNEIVYGQKSLDWEMLYHTINELHDNLFDRLKEKYPNLNDMEIHICCLTYTNFSSSEIALILDLSVNTVQMKRSSLRKKLGIGFMGNINEFLDTNLSNLNQS